MILCTWPSFPARKPAIIGVSEPRFSLRDTENHQSHFLRQGVTTLCRNWNIIPSQGESCRNSSVSSKSCLHWFLLTLVQRYVFLISEVSKLETTAAPKRLPSTTGAYCSNGEHWDSHDYCPQVSPLPALAAQNTACTVCCGNRTGKRQAAETLRGCSCNCPNTPQQNNKRWSPGGRKQRSPDLPHRLKFGDSCLIWKVNGRTSTGWLIGGVRVSPMQSWIQIQQGMT